jgi:hypothetical protein
LSSCCTCHAGWRPVIALQVIRTRRCFGHLHSSSLRVLPGTACAAYRQTSVAHAVPASTGEPLLFKCPKQR